MHGRNIQVQRYGNEREESWGWGGVRVVVEGSTQRTDQP